MSTNPYPYHLVNNYQLYDGTNITIRPVRLDDADKFQDFIRKLSSELKHLNYMENFKELSPDTLKNFILIDYRKKMTFIAIHKQDNKELTIGMGRYIVDVNSDKCEFDIIIADAWQNKGLGTLLMNLLITSAKAAGVNKVNSTVLSSNIGGLALAKHCGFKITNSDDPTISNVEKNL